MRKEKIMRFFLAAVLAISMLAMPLTTAYAESVSSSSDAAPSSAVSSSTGTESFLNPLPSCPTAIHQIWIRRMTIRITITSSM